MSEAVRDLKDKVIVVTGAASGIGRALVLHGARQGMHVVLADIDVTRLEAVADEARSLGAQALAVETDVGSAMAVEQLASRAFEAFGKVNVLVNNAGIGNSGAAWTMPLETWEQVLRVNLHGVVYGVHSFVGRMLESGEPGHVINVASAAGLISVPGFGAYSASKFGVVGLSEALFHDLRVRKANITVSVLCPSWVQTRIMTQSLVPPTGVDAIDANVSLAVSRAVEHGITAEAVAQSVFAAVENETFYILTHEDTFRAVAVRTEDILQGRKPTMAIVDRKKR